MATGDFKSKFKAWTQNMQREAARWAVGRNGADELANATVNLAIIIVIVDLLINSRVLSWIGLALLAYGWFRISSKNIAARSRENELALQKGGKVIRFLVNPVAAFTEQKNYVHLACPSCGQKVRIPRGKGKVRVTCPKCHTRFDGKA